MLPNQDNSPYNFSPEVSDGSAENPSIAFLEVIFKRFDLQELIGKYLSDPREKKGDYDFDTIIKTVLGNCLFLTGSQNSFHTIARKTLEQEANVANFVGSKNGKIPNPKTIDNVMREMDYEQCNNILLDLFEKVRLSKLFFNHPELIPDDYYHFAYDGEVIHTYRSDADHDCESCPYCLRRTRETKTWYNHTILVVSIVAPGGFKMPIYIHPIRAEAVRDKETASDDDHKQQCESSAFKIVVRKIRERFPKLKICNLLDSLYANGPCLDLHEELNMRHDYSRHPHAQMTWVAMLNLAIALEHIFIYTSISVKLRKKMSIRDFMKDLFNEIRYFAREKIDRAVKLLGNIQFRFSHIRKTKIWFKIDLIT